MGHVKTLGEQLAENGFSYSCFVSWPSKSSDKVRRIVQKLQKNIQEDALDAGLPDAVFLSNDMQAGTEWHREISLALCRSICMIAVCGPHYYRSEWCGREWAGMRQLGAERLGGNHVPIVPLILKPLPAEGTEGFSQLEESPPGVQALQCLDLSRSLLWCSAPEEDLQFANIAKETVKKVAQMARLLIACKADCGGFWLPERSAFEEYVVKPLRYPLLTESV